MIGDIKIKELLNDNNIIISPFNSKNLGPNSYDLTLNKTIKLIKTKNKVIDITKDTLEYETITLPYTIKPNETIIGMTNEKIGCKRGYLGIVMQRSNLARLPLHINYSPLVDTGFYGVLSGAITNLTNFDIKISENVRFLQISFINVIGFSSLYSDRKWSKNVNQTGIDVPEYKIDKEWL